jgi:hypothetical protein
MLRNLVVSVWFLMHPVHVTLTSIDFLPEKAGYNVFVRMYFDDFLTDTRLNGSILKDADFTGGTAAAKEEIERYMNGKLQLKVNDKILSGKLTDSQVAENEISMNFEYIGGRKPAVITVKNMIMTDLYADMSNMVIVKVNDYEEGVKLTSDITEQIFKIK